MTGSRFRLVTIVALQKSQVWTRGRARSEVLHARVGGQDPSVLVQGKGVRVVDVHLDEVLVEAVGAAAPAAVGVEELAVVEADLAAHHAGEGLAGLGQRVEEVALAALRERRVLVVARQVAQPRPLEHQRAYAGDAVLRLPALAHLGAEDDDAVGHAARRVKGDLEPRGEAGRLADEGVELALVLDEVLSGAIEQVVAFGLVSYYGL